jgi:hypothetical protein
MDLPDEVRADLLVAAVVALCTVALSLALRYGLDVTASPLVRMAPIAVYFGYLFFGKGSTGSAVERADLWMVAAVVVTVGVGAYAAV